MPLDHKRISATAVLGFLLVAGCGPNRPDGSLNYDRNRISEAEIQAGRDRGVGNAYDLVRSIRSHWLRPAPSGASPGSTEPAAIVYENNVQLGGVRTLTGIPLTSVMTIRFMSPSEARARFGDYRSGGAIQVVTVTGR